MSGRVSVVLYLRERKKDWYLAHLCSLLAASRVANEIEQIRPSSRVSVEQKHRAYKGVGDGGSRLTSVAYDALLPFNNISVSMSFLNLVVVLFTGPATEGGPFNASSPKVIMTAREQLEIRRAFGEGRLKRGH